MSRLDPYHLTMLSFASRSGTFRWNIQRYSPFALRTRVSYSKTSPVARQARHLANPLNVLGVNDSCPIPASHFVQSDPQVLQPRFIEVIEVTVRPGGVNQRRNRVDKELDVKRLGFSSWGGHGGHLTPGNPLLFNRS